MSHVYTRALGMLTPGRLFGMVNYKGAYMRVQGDVRDDGVHLPIVEVATGRLFYMSREKPCVLFLGEEP